MQETLRIILLFSFLFISSEILRKNKYLAWITFLILPFLLIHYWLRFEHNTFIWLKFYTVEITTSFMLYCRYNQKKEIKPWYSTVIYIFVLTNILEAVLQNLVSSTEQNFLTHYVNGATGILLILSMPRKNFIHVDFESREKNLLVDYSFIWILAYSCWNTLFIYIEWPDFLGIQLGIILSSFVVAIFNPKLWAHTRAMTLGIYLLLHFWNYHIFDSMLMTDHTNPTVALVLIVITFIGTCGYTIHSKLLPIFSANK
jgi:hypothetical protein